MKRKGSVSYIIALICILLAFSLIPLQSTTAQPEEDPDFIITLALMAVADDRLDGVMDLSALSNLRAVVDEYYNIKTFINMNEPTRTALNTQKNLVLSELDRKIDFEKSLSYRAQLGLFTGMVDQLSGKYDRDGFYKPFDHLKMALFSEFTPDPQIIAMLQKRLAGDTQSALTKDLDGHLAANVDKGLDLVGQSSDTHYDFEAGTSGGGARLIELIQSPLIFVNRGMREIRILVEYYEPLSGLAASAPVLNQQLAGGTSVILDGFPQGNYVFCFDWQTDLDTDNDYLKDYDRAVTHVWISGAGGGNLRDAQEVSVSAGYSDTPIGRCDGFKGEAPQTETLMAELMETEDTPEEFAAEPTPEVLVPTDIAPQDEGGSEDEPGAPMDGTEAPPDADFWNQEDDDSSPMDTGSNLTSAELANQGTHGYSMTCLFGDSPESSSFTATWDFSESGALYVEKGLFYARVSPNVYQTDYPTIVTFTSGGYLTSSHYYETDSNGQEVRIPIECTATFQ